MTRIALTESTDARNSRMWGLFHKAEPGFDRHVILIRWQEPHVANPQWVAWLEGPRGYEDRVSRGVPGYEALLLSTGGTVNT